MRRVEKQSGYPGCGEGERVSAAETAAAIQKCYSELSAAHSEQPGTYPVLNIEAFDCVDSTNNICLEMAARGEQEGYVAVASCQTAGRGRSGRSFYSPEGTGLYMSILLRPREMDASQALSLTTIAAVAVSQAIELVTCKSAGIKWVNDIYMDGLKVCGILTEASFDPETQAPDYAVVGIGINVKAPAGGFPEEIRGIAGAIYSEADTIERNRLAAAVLSRFMHYYKGEEPYIGEYRKRCIVIGRHVDVLKPGQPGREAFVTGLDERCGLQVRYADDSEETLSSGEIRIKVTE